MRVIFFGTSIFAARVLEALLVNDGVDVIAVVTRKDKPRGRSGKPMAPPVKERLLQQENGCPIHQPLKASDPEFAEILRKYEADLFVVVAYGEILRQNILDIPPLGCINVHASLLPKYRGAAPIQRCLMNGEEASGVTIMHMTAKLDAGDIIEQQVVPVDDNTSGEDLEGSLCKAGINALLKVISDFDKGVFNRVPQDDTKATYAQKITSDDCNINWFVSAEDIHNLVRSLYPKPSSCCDVSIRGNDKRLKIHKSCVVDISGQPGDILSYGDNLIIGCGKQALEIIELQLEGKKKMPSKEFCKGIPPKDFSIIV